MPEKYRKDYPTTSMDTVAEFANPIDVETRQNKATAQKHVNTTPEGSKVDVVQKRVKKNSILLQVRDYI